MKRNHPEPDLPFFVKPYMIALRDLSGDRINTQYGINGIPFVAKLAYAKWQQVRNEEDFMDLITVVDDIYVETVNERLQKKDK